MSRAGMPIHVGNDFVLRRPRPQVIAPAPSVTPVMLPSLAAAAIAGAIDEAALAAVIPHPQVFTPNRISTWQRGVNGLHDHSFIAFTLLLLLVGSTGIDVFGRYRAAAIEAAAKPALSVKVTAPQIAGLNLTLPTAQFDARLQSIVNQSASLTVGDKTEPIAADSIKSWLKISPSADKSQTSVHINAATIAASLTELAKKYEKAPINEVTSTASGTASVIAAGRTGYKLTDPSTLQTQAAAVAKTILDAKGMQFTTPLETQNFASVTPAAFSKMIEINVDSKQMYLYDNGTITHTYPISAGAPSTPTPIGQYKIFSKMAVQDMKGFNANGTKYFQPHVRWINYFLGGGYAIHGNYWRPADWFGNINSSHGCASLPDEQAKEVYDWAPIGTPVITHH